MLCFCRYIIDGTAASTLRQREPGLFTANVLSYLWNNIVLSYLWHVQDAVVCSVLWVPHIDHHDLPVRLIGFFINHAQGT